VTVRFAFGTRDAISSSVKPTTPRQEAAMNRNPYSTQTTTATNIPHTDRMLRDLAFVLKLTRETVTAIRQDTPERRRKAVRN
jgi:hypothetical protein